ncbi:MAG: GyrI-like domain-containing protein [Firmicutes bacterium]|nr:GyrI-like domain-containing protein [Bacillota bacterium]
MNYEIVFLEEKLVVGKSIVTSNEGGKAIGDIADLWQNFIGDGIFDGIKNKQSSTGIGLYTDYEGDFTKPYRFMCCTEILSFDNPDLELRKISAGKYAKFTVKGDVQIDIGKAWGEIWKMDLARKYSNDFEHYLYDSDDMKNQTVEIYIAIK